MQKTLALLYMDVDGNTYVLFVHVFLGFFRFVLDASLYKKSGELTRVCKCSRPRDPSFPSHLAATHAHTHAPFVLGPIITTFISQSLTLSCFLLLPAPVRYISHFQQCTNIGRQTLSVSVWAVENLDG